MKLGRNDQCNCGSGKKYKKCCLKKDNILIGMQKEEELVAPILSDLIKYSAKHYQRSFESKMAERLPEIINTEQQYLEYIMPPIFQWGIFNLPLASNGETPFESYITKRRIPKNQLELLLKWKTELPSIFRITHQSNGYTHLTDFWSNEERIVKMGDLPEEITDGSTYLLNSLLPGEHQSFLSGLPQFITFELLDDVVNKIESLRNEQSPNQALETYYPEVTFYIYELLYAYEEDYNEDYEDSEGNNDNEDKPLTSEEQAVLEVYRKLTNQTLSEQVHQKVTALWSGYCEHHKPVITKPETYAAALEYLGHHHFQGEDPQAKTTQKELANKYGVSPGTISTRKKAFTEYLAQTA
ncbi:SEC-C metal-binding domain-containing protein [Pseudalkalibacillus berkeleyi]|uniref:SEC-C domain-containing protein n=1 Tax=Pseudalkalibacillus berkeleyi TaxID=1069813 RepID=A0ABS9GXM0_9BACL|nr:SEC-C metal-binding domain-containing protein [Pseudalkalibacillus berkeleyi]MCF6136561.1 SEC-C domain-containing protein [Pseudalkalibacillus berkeleyi]